MLIDIIQHTPTWVFFLFCGLLYIGILRTRPRTVSPCRLLLLPIAIGVYSLRNVYLSFADTLDATPHNGVVLVGLIAWLGATLTVLGALASLPDRHDVQYLPQIRKFLIPGSWLPLCWLMCIFFSKYVIAVALAVQPALHQSMGFAVLVGALYGALSGNLIGGAWRIWRTQPAISASSGPLSATDIYAGKP